MKINLNKSKVSKKNPNKEVLHLFLRRKKQEIERKNNNNYKNNKQKEKNKSKEINNNLLFNNNNYFNKIFNNK